MTYGSLGAAVGMMMWMWISMVVLLVGARSTLKSSIRPLAIRRLSGTSR